MLCLGLVVSFRFPSLQWWAELKKPPSKNNFYKAHIWSTRRSELKPQTPTDRRVFSLMVRLLLAEFHNCFPCFGNLGLSGGLRVEGLDNVHFATSRRDRKTEDVKGCSSICALGCTASTAWTLEASKQTQQL